MMRGDSFFNANVPAAKHPPPVDGDEFSCTIEERWLTFELLELLDGEPRFAMGCDVRQLLLATADWLNPETSKAACHVCRGLYLMTYGLHRAALVEFERALDGRLEERPEPISRLALEAHAFSVLRIGCERDARTEFERLIDRQLERPSEPAPKTVNHIAELIGVLRRIGVVE